MRAVAPTARAVTDHVDPIPLPIARAADGLFFFRAVVLGRRCAPDVDFRAGARRDCVPFRDERAVVERVDVDRVEDARVPAEELRAGLRDERDPVPLAAGCARAERV
ncbi:hypothetical protein [Hoyosella rhizosphaerae]|uniref:hypothetical protein n=1 Tax=Hoyosella rhizosphaerae TaxID=1755582 RepID=UPI0035563B28